jgi:hypothetical protein
MLAVAGLAPAAMARNGADDPAGHNAGDDHGGKVVVKARAARHGADDPAGDDRGGKRVKARATRRGADDPAGDDRGRGRDDGPNHR